MYSLARSTLIWGLMAGLCCGYVAAWALASPWDRAVWSAVGAAIGLVFGLALNNPRVCNAFRLIRPRWPKWPRSLLRWLFRFSLRRMLVGVTAIAIGLGVWAAILEVFARQRNAALKIAQLCGTELVAETDPDVNGLLMSADGTIRFEYFHDAHGIPMWQVLLYKTLGPLRLCQFGVLDFPWGIAIFDTVNRDGTDRVGTVPIKPVLKELPQMFALRDIFIYSDSFTDDDFAVFSQFRWLESLHVRSSNISADCIDRVAALPNLTSVGLDFAYSDMVDMYRSDELVRLPHDLSPSRLMTMGFKKLAVNKKLESLTICYAPISDDDAAAIGGMPIGMLRLFNVAITDAGLQAISANRAINDIVLSDRYDTMLTLARLQIFARRHFGSIGIYWPTSEPGMLAPFARQAIGGFEVSLGALNEGDMAVLLQSTCYSLDLRDTPVSARQMARLKAKSWVTGLKGGKVIEETDDSEADDDMPETATLKSGAESTVQESAAGD